jgi:two-component system OmpR family response regulator
MSLPEKLHVLLVEDSVVTAEDLCEAIRKHLPQVSCTVAATESDALEKIESSAFSAAVLDVQLKEGNGFAVLRKLAALEPKPFIVVLTNYALPQYREFAMLVGADYFLDKATSIDVLPDLFDRYIINPEQSATTLAPV